MPPRLRLIARSRRRRRQRHASAAAMAPPHYAMLLPPRHAFCRAAYTFAAVLPRH